MRKSLPNRGQGRCKDLFEALQLAISRLRLTIPARARPLGTIPGSS
ncbi:BQ5605_C012g06729 [Microbotryum silenes-dioicae]|uniref:BQ5605_C012g06729 protein n=1 Tax=Microbotryum silenes-dioicae TaxID=796604 RepID=A0A2X0MLC1_9BASI|nr:BQ5605_C012g06729 [Microbotryum silenes-dioicae]